MKKLLPLGLLAIAIILAVPVYVQFGSPAKMMLKRQSASTAGVAEPMMGKPGIMMAEDSYMARDMAQTSTIMPYHPPVYQGGVYLDVADRTIVKTGYLALVVDDIQHAVTRITDITATQQGLVSYSNIYEDPMNAGLKRAELTLRVPSDKLDATVGELRNLAVRVTSESINAMDQTQQKVDLDAQLKNLRATEEQLLEIMDQATTVEETLQVQTQLSQTRSQIESLQAQVDNLQGAAEYSTLQVSLGTEDSQLPVVDPSQRSLKEEIIYTFKQSLILYRQLLLGLLRLTIMALPLIILGGLVWLFSRARSK